MRHESGSDLLLADRLYQKVRPVDCGSGGGGLLRAERRQKAGFWGVRRHNLRQLGLRGRDSEAVVGQDESGKMAGENMDRFLHRGQSRREPRN